MEKTKTEVRKQWNNISTESKKNSGELTINYFLKRQTSSDKHQLTMVNLNKWSLTNFKGGISSRKKNS